MIIKFKKISLFILTFVILVFFITSLVKSDDDLEKSYKNFVKETTKIRSQLGSLPTSPSNQALAIDEAIKEMDRAVEFAQANFKTNDFEITEKTLNFVGRALTDINNSVPKEFVNDLTVVDMSKLKDKELKEVYQVSIEMKNNKKEKLTSLVKDMTEVDKNGLNLFEVSKNINDLGVKTISILDIAKTVVENPTIKSEVLESAEKGISPEYLAEQLAEAEKLGIAESTEKLSEVAIGSGFNKDVMPSLETMRSDFFDPDAHNAAMAEMAEDIQSGGVGDGVGAAEAAASYTDSDRDAQKAQSEADCTGSCAGDTESGK
jgi:Zn-dependent M32 family carboxypeptidase